MQKDLRIDGFNHRFAFRDYYEHVEIVEDNLWRMSGAQLVQEEQRCRLKLAEARFNLRRIPHFLLFIGLPGELVMLLYSAHKTAIGFLVALAWTLVTIVLPMRGLATKTNFERTVVKHYSERLQKIMLIQRDRAEVGLLEATGYLSAEGIQQNG